MKEQSYKAQINQKTFWLGYGMSNKLFTSLLSLSLVLGLCLCTMQASSQTIPFQITPEGHILVKAKIEANEGTFIFDTGGGINLFFSDFAKKLKSRSTYNFFTAFRATGERIDVPLFYNDELEFGNLKFKTVPYASVDMKVSGIDGLLSLHMFQNTDIIIDYVKKQLLIKDIDSAKHKKYIDIQISTFADNALDIFTYVVLDEKLKIKVLLDSGAGNDSYWISTKFMDLLAVDRSAINMIEKKSEFDENKSSKIYKTNIQSISNRFLTVKQPKVNFVDGLIYEGKTSINWLGNKIGISLKNKKIYLFD